MQIDRDQMLSDLVALTQRMPHEPDRKKLLSVFMDAEGLDPQQRAFVNEFAIDFNAAAAAERLNLSPHAGAQFLRSANVRDAVKGRLDEQEQWSSLKAEYVRDYIFSVLEFHPTDYFQLDPDGGWCIDPGEFANVPHKVKRLVESVEMRQIGQRKVLSVKFVSKSQALALAARYTLTQTIDTNISVVPWDSIADAAAAPYDDVVERRIKQLRAG